MGRTQRNKCTYDYTVKIDLTPIVDEIIRRLPGDEGNDWEVEGDELIIYMSDTGMAEEWYCRETRESPAEYDLELQNSVDEVDIDKAIIEALHSVKNSDGLINCEIDYDSIEVDYPDPYDDGDRAYDAWKDRQFEEY